MKKLIDTYPLDLNLSDNRRVHLVSRIKAVSITMFAVALLQCALTLIFPIGPQSSPGEVYIRNGLSVISYLILSAYLDRLSYICKHSKHRSSTMKRFKIFTLIMIAICSLKIAVSLFFSAICLVKNNLILFYYVGDIAVWGIFIVLLLFIYKNIQVDIK